MEIEERRKLVANFLQHCIVYSDASIDRKEKRGDSRVEIDKWIAYRDFIKITLKEVKSKELDSWLNDGKVSYEPGEKK